MYEFNKEDSFWRPYLDLIPDIGNFGHPLFWKEEEIKKELSGMAIHSTFDFDEFIFSLNVTYTISSAMNLLYFKQLPLSLLHFNMNTKACWSLHIERGSLHSYPGLCLQSR